jgi:hypothetical protein
MQCMECFRDHHRFLPLHRIQHWAGEYFAPAWMCQVGVEIHLGHNGQPCPSRNRAGPANENLPYVSVDSASESVEPASDDEQDDGWEDERESNDEGEYGIPALAGPDVCVVVDKSGVHRIRIRPCQCHGHPPLDLQFLDMGLFPTSLRRIQTVFTFGVLDDFRMDNLECKTAGLNYYNKLRRLTSNEFPEGVPVGGDILVCGSMYIDRLFQMTG